MTTADSHSYALPGFVHRPAQGHDCRIHARLVGHRYDTQPKLKEPLVCVRGEGSPRLRTSLGFNRGHMGGCCCCRGAATVFLARGLTLVACGPAPSAHASPAPSDLMLVRMP